MVRHYEYNVCQGRFSSIRFFDFAVSNSVMQLA